MIKHRRLPIAIGAGALVAAGLAHAQAPSRVWRIGFLALTPGPDAAVEAFREQLKALGYLEGRNLSFEFRWADGNQERLAEFAADLVRLKVDAIVTRTTDVAAAAKRATSVIPIVMATSADPVGAGIVASLARPDGNVTGITQNSTEAAGKLLQLLRDAAPKTRRLGIIVFKGGLSGPLFVEQIQRAAQKMGITPVVQEVNEPEALAAAFGTMQRQRAQALIMQATPFTGTHRARIRELAAQHRLPSILENRASVEAGGLISYGASIPEMHRHAALYVDKILKGARPADLPAEQPTKYELVINLKNAKTLGIRIPQSLLVRADEVIQ